MRIFVILCSQAPALEASLNIAREEVARLRAGCKLLRDACAQARGDREAEALQQQLDVLGALASAPLQYNSPLDHIRHALFHLNKAPVTFSTLNSHSPQFPLLQCFPLAPSPPSLAIHHLT